MMFGEIAKAIDCTLMSKGKGMCQKYATGLATRYIVEEGVGRSTPGHLPERSLPLIAFKVVDTADTITIAAPREHFRSSQLVSRTGL